MARIMRKIIKEEDLDKEKLKGIILEYVGNAFEFSDLKWGLENNLKDNIILDEDELAVVVSELINEGKLKILTEKVSGRENLIIGVLKKLEIQEEKNKETEIKNDKSGNEKGERYIAHYK